MGNYTAFQALRRRLRARRRRAHRRSGTVPPRRSRRPWPRRAGDAGGGDHGGPRGGERGPDASVPAAAPAATAGPSALRIVVVHPDLLGTYGDGGNGQVLAGRAVWRDIPVELVHALSDAPLPEGADVYCLGGGEDGPQVQSAERLRDGALARCRGGRRRRVGGVRRLPGHRPQSFPGADGRPHRRGRAARRGHGQGPGRRAVGELAADPIGAGPGGRRAPDPVALEHADRLREPRRRHASRRRARPLARVLSGVGNGSRGPTPKGRASGLVLGTYATVPPWPATPPSPTSCWRGPRVGARAPSTTSRSGPLRAERLDAAGARGWRHPGHGARADAVRRMRSLVRSRRT